MTWLEPDSSMLSRIFVSVVQLSWCLLLLHVLRLWSTCTLQNIMQGKTQVFHWHIHRDDDKPLPFMADNRPFVLGSHVTDVTLSVQHHRSIFLNLRDFWSRATVGNLMDLFLTRGSVNLLMTENKAICLCAFDNVINSIYECDHIAGS